MNPENTYNRHPTLWINQNHLFINFNKCDAWTDDWSDMSEIWFDVQYIKLGQIYAISIEYVREINAMNVYLDGVKIQPVDKSHSRIAAHSVCYGIEAQLMLSGPGVPVDGYVQNFIYQPNFSGKLLGGMLRPEILETCDSVA